MVRERFMDHSKIDGNRRNLGGQRSVDLTTMTQRSAEHYLNGAQELRAAAAKRHRDEIASRILLNAAEQCERRARDLELRGMLKLPGEPAIAH